TPTPTPTKVCPAPTPYNSTPIWKNTTPTLPEKVPTPELTPTPSWSCPSLIHSWNHLGQVTNGWLSNIIYSIPN
ncbi:unnamed protein product, partial [Rotaria magnacalcarata]